jgi:hypothetical protein
VLVLDGFERRSYRSLRGLLGLLGYMIMSVGLGMGVGQRYQSAVFRTIHKLGPTYDANELQ